MLRQSRRQRTRSRRNNNKRRRPNGRNAGTVGPAKLTAAGEFRSPLCIKRCSYESA